MRSLLWTLCCLLLCAAPAVGDEPSAQPGLDLVTTDPVVIGQKLTLRSQILDDTVTMDIAVPDSFEVSSSAHTYPVIFVHGWHGEQFFKSVAGLVKHLADRERMPESLVVSLNDIGDIPKIYTHGMWSGRETLGGEGDPEASARHLRDEVFPYLTETYRANDHRMIIGVSGSSLFPIYTLTEAPDLFDSYVLVAAADTLGMGHDADSTFIDAFEASLEADPKRRVHLFVGTAEYDLDGEPEYQKNLDDLNRQLGRFEHLNLVEEVFPRSDHYAVLMKVMLAVVEQNYPPERWSARYRDLVAQPGDALANIDRYYQELSEHYGFTILPRADRWNNVNCLRFMIRHLIREERPKEAIAVARRRIEYRPTQADSHKGLADALAADGQHDAAVEAQEKAIALARQAGDEESLESLQERLDELKAARDEASEDPSR